MGRRAARRRRRSKAQKRTGRCSDPEDHDYVKNTNRTEIIDEDNSGWDSLDDQTLLDYAENAAVNDPSTLVDEMEVTKRLSGLNVSAIVELPESSIVTSDGETVFSELPSTILLDDPGERETLARLEERYCRKRGSKRNRKRTKKVKILPPELEEGESMAERVGGKYRRASYVSKLRFNPISWHKQSSVLTDDSQQGLTTEPDHTTGLMGPSDTSSRALTESDSPTVDDIIMLDEAGGEDEVEGFSIMDAQENCTLNEHNMGLGTTVESSTLVSQSNSESELTETSSDSGCDGDDEESSVEISGSLKVSRTAYATGINTNGWWDNCQSSADEMFEDEMHFQQILASSFPLLSPEGQQTVSLNVKTQIRQDSEFKHPQLCGIQGRRDSRKIRKKPSMSYTITTPRDLSQRISDFIQCEADMELHLPMLSRPLCRTASNLAQAHSLECMIHQKRRLPVAAPLLKKTSSTRLASKAEIEAVLRDHQRELTSPILWTKRTKKRTCVLPVRVPVSALCCQTESMTVVGRDAPPINEHNIGNQILRTMGWKPGCGLGVNENGIRHPVMANRRPKLAGLGYTQ